MTSPNPPEPTIDLAPRKAAPFNRASVASSRPRMRFVKGRLRFSHETAGLLRSRLEAATLVLAVVLVLALVGNLFSDYAPLLGLRLLIVLAFVGGSLALRSKRPFSLVQLRWFEAILFGLLAAQLLLMMGTRLVAFARQEDAVSVVSAQHAYLAGWAMLILTYSILMPNTWQRALVVLLPTACLPYGLLFWLHWQFPAIQSALEQDRMGSFFPTPFVAVFVAVFGAYTVNAVRREAFKAKQLGQYVLKSKLGAGGMGEVYRAEHQLLKRPCVVKLIKPSKADDAAVLARFEREVQATARLTHWNTIEVYDYGHADDGTFYYVMELLPGLSLEDMVEQYGPLPPERAIHFLRQACKALREAHAKGLIHRDIKPANVFAAERGGVYDLAKLLDFGLVREQVRTEGEAKLTQQGSFSGSPLYMCPEQVTAYEKLDARSDIYSLGAVAYFLLTGGPPFEGEDVWEVIAAHRRDPVKPPAEVNAAVPPDLDSIVIRCLAKLPANRFQDVESLDAALAGCACAGKWTEDQAAAWWRDVGKKNAP
jgi:eukaryotic-like serine/threonine-protein kinase